MKGGGIGLPKCDHFHVAKCNTLDEEAAFWDTHSVLDEINEGTVVGFHQAHKTDTLTIRFAHEDIQRLREEADEQGVGPSTLARMLVKKGLRTL